jgi:NAD(P)H dehydrogenase (quinone)
MLPILVTGPAGNTGQIIVNQFQQLGVPFVAMTHNMQRVRDFEARGIPVRYGNFDDPSSLDKALKGIGTAYLVCTPDDSLFDRESNFIDSAERARLDHVVYHSAHLAHTHSPSPNLANHGRVEELLQESGLPHTIIRPGGYMQTWALFTWALLTGRKDFGVLSMPGGDGKIPLVDMRDIAKATMKVLQEPEQHLGKTYIITGLASMGYAEYAEIWSRVLGKPVEYRSSSEEQFKLVMRAVGSAEGAAYEHVLQLFRWQRAGKLDKVYPGLNELGIPFTPFEDFARDWVAGRTGGGGSFELQDLFRVRMMNRIFLKTVAARRSAENVWQSARTFLGRKTR